MEGGKPFAERIVNGFFNILEAVCLLAVIIFGIYWIGKALIGFIKYYAKFA
ncbi:MAG: hypothetical protein NT096_13450 [Proteobacteria bacterium]|nr:hypothetical protein [Pseudomonadota bacterium]